MTKDEFGRIMKTLNDVWGGYGPTSYDSWFKIMEKYPFVKASTAVWSLAETLKTKPRIADITEAMGRDIVNGGNHETEYHGCGMCSGGWVNVEVTPGMMASLRCMCELGERLSPRLAMITPDMIKARRFNIRGELKYPNADESVRENKLQKMNTDETIAWCRRGLAQMANNMRF